MAIKNNSFSELHVVDTLDNNRLIALKPLPYVEKQTPEAQTLNVASENGAASMKEAAAPVEPAQQGPAAQAHPVPGDITEPKEESHKELKESPKEDNSTEKTSENQVKSDEAPQLTLEEIEQMEKPQAPAANADVDGGFDVPSAVAYGQYAQVLSQPANLGLGFGGGNDNQQVDEDKTFLPFLGETRFSGINAENDLQVVSREDFPVYNVTLLLDYSLSMNLVVGANGETRLQLLQEAIAGSGGLLDAYENASSQFTLSIVYFGGAEPGTGTYISQYGTDIDAARTDILNNSPSLGTRYDLAMAFAQEDFQIDSHYAYLDNAINRAYFFSDGEPTNPQPGDPGSASSYNDWQSDLLSYNIDAYSVGIAANTLVHLTQLDNPGDSVIQAASDLSNLNELLNDTVPALTGNVMNNDLPPSQFPPTWVSQYYYDSNGDGNADTLGTIGTTVHLQHGDFTLFSDGKYIYNPDPNFEDQLINEDILYTIRDTVNQQDSANLHIQINPLSDDRPHAVNDFQSIARDDLPAYNVTLLLDYSGSMASVVGANGETRLQLMQEALTGPNGLLSAYQNASSEINLNIVYFGGSDPVTGTYVVRYGGDIAQATNDINSFSLTLGTDYKQALELGTGVFAQDASLAYLNDFVNRAYFISDGAPTTVADYDAWQAAIAAYHVDVMSVSIAPIDNTFLPLIANPDDDPLVIDVANDLSNLADLLVGTVPTFTENVMTNDLPLSSNAPNTVIQFFYDSDNNTSPDKLGTLGTSNQLLHGSFTLNANGSYSYTPEDGTENTVIDEYVRYFIADTSGKIDDAILHIHIDPLSNAGPTAVNDNFVLTKDDLPSYNLTLLLDYSNSMNVAVGPNNETRLQLLQEALTGANGLLNAYQSASSELHVSIVYFGGADPTGTYFFDYGTDIAHAMNDINTFTTTLGTDYKGALELGMIDFAADAANPALAGSINQAYFISDGQPTTATDIDNPVYAAWQAAIDAYDVNVTSVSIAPIDNTYLPLIANPGDNPPVIQVANDLSNLNDLLVDTIVTVKGDITTNDSENGNPPLSVVSYFYDSTHNGYPDTLGTIGSPVDLLYGSLVLNADGTFEYKRFQGYENTHIEENIRYTIQDANGNIDDALFHLEINPNTTVPPIVLDLDGNGLSLISLQESQIFYDLNQDGHKEHTAWVAPGDGILAYDINGDHQVTNASEFVLTNYAPEAKTDLEAMRMAFDSNHDGVFDMQDQEWAKFGLWQDANQNGVSDQGEFKSLNQMGIASINLTTDGSGASPIADNTIHGITTFTRADGSHGSVGDVALNYEAVMASTQILNETASDTNSAPSSDTTTDAPVAVYVPAHEETQMAAAEHVAA